MACRWLKPQSDIHCNRSATSPRPKFKTIAEVAEESQLGFAFGLRLVGDWSATYRGLVADWSATSWGPLCDLIQLVTDRSGTGPRLVVDQSPISRRPSQLKTVIKKKNIDNIFKTDELNMVHILSFINYMYWKINGCKDYTIRSVEIGRSFQPWCMK